MSSLLARQFLALGERFQERYPHAWLVWEPGTWHAPAADAANDATRLPTGPQPDRPAKGDALCFELEPNPRKPVLVLGRSRECDLVISDATVSRRHIQMERAPTGWRLQPLAEAGATQLGGERARAGSWHALVPGQKLTLGDVQLTYLHAPELAARIADESLRLR